MTDRTPDPPPLSRRRLLNLMAGTTLAALVGCASDPDSPDSRLTDGEAEGGRRGDARSADAAPAGEYWPPAASDHWESVDPEAVGFDPDRLDELETYAKATAGDSLVVLHDGRLLTEGHWARRGEHHLRDVASVQKSITALLLAMAIDRGLLALDQPVTDVLGSGWAEAGRADERRIEIGHLAAMTAGLTDGFTVASAPGTTWRYHSEAYQRLRPVLEAVTGDGIQAVSDAWLFEPLDISSARWAPRRGRGEFALDPTGFDLWGLRMTARDLARIGLLVQRDGRWRERQLVGTDTLGATITPSQDLNPSYGLLWWLNGQDAYMVPRSSDQRPGPLVPTAPDDMVAALGANDQKLYVSRGELLVVSRLGGRAAPAGKPALSSFDARLWSTLERAHLDAGS